MSFLDLVDEKEYDSKMVSDGTSNSDEENDDTGNDSSSSSTESEDDGDATVSEDDPKEEEEEETAKKVVQPRRRRGGAQAKKNKTSAVEEKKSFNMYALSGKKQNIITTNTFKVYSDNSLKRKTATGRLFKCNTKCFARYASKHAKFNNKLSSMGYQYTNDDTSSMFLGDDEY